MVEQTDAVLPLSAAASRAGLSEPQLRRLLKRYPHALAHAGRRGRGHSCTVLMPQLAALLGRPLACDGHAARLLHELSDKLAERFAEVIPDLQLWCSGRESRAIAAFMAATSRLLIEHEIAKLSEK